MSNEIITLSGAAIDVMYAFFFAVLISLVICRPIQVWVNCANWD
ncbi:TPA: hypothetical protein ACWO8H_002432 [Salmonella enterica subsp. enterica serovar Muenchen]|nr:hypothetical protein [Salmonella enterica]ESG78462.1 hypothetical protein SEEK9263_22033 [Salmonella enterica subsp. enterica serovar Kentucky str. ATCC 9263]WQN53494.1 hypothetical protein DLM91_17885 [Salmonella enterica subsp. enterica serovar Newport str. S-38A-RVX]WQN58104.1 hypothetical protein DLM89_18070 [Salmonella enterica subsp. enterica serovar Newport str. JY-221A-RVX]WVK42459.1 hypothetical protein SM158_05830 [Salmonella enterica subsp. enterica serovar Newport str. PL01]WVK4